MVEPRFLIIKGGALGDVIHTLPAAAVLRDTFPTARIDWAIQPRWARVLECNPDIREAIAFENSNPIAMVRALSRMRSTQYTCAIDFQSLYKSALLSFACGAPRRIGFPRTYAREGFASVFYTERVNPSGAHKVDHNLTLAYAAGARPAAPRFPIAIHAQDDETVSRNLERHKLSEFFVLNPGGGWLSKCWPAERYGQLHRKIFERYGWRGIVSCGPGEEHLAQAVIDSAGNPPPVALKPGLGPLFALLRRSKFVVSADTGPLHLASALGAPVVALFGPTDPSRNGPFSPDDVVVRNPGAGETTYRRGKSYSPAMLSITVDQVMDAIERRLEHRR
ncbi:MAG: glycosyltransferase family 9 protein [Candidatus Acidiferrales bacterium]